MIDLYFLKGNCLLVLSWKESFIQIGHSLIGYGLNPRQLFFIRTGANHKGPTSPPRIRRLSF